MALFLNTNDECVVKFHSITTPIYLDSPLYKIGDYSDNRGMTEEVRAVKELVLTGDEEWRKSTAYAGNFYARVMLNIRSLGDDAYCTHATQVKIPITAEKFVYGTFATESLYSNSAALNLFLGQPEWTVDDFKSYLQQQYSNGTPVTVYYVLVEPETKTVEPVEIPTLNGTTVVDVDTEVKPSNMWVEYKSSTSEYNPITLRTIDNQALYTADNEILQTRR